MHPGDQRLVGRQLLQALRLQQLVQRGIAGGGRTQGDGGDGLQTLVQLRAGHAQAFGNGVQLPGEGLHVEAGGGLHHRGRVDLPRHRFEHAALVLALQVDGQAADRRALLAVAELVPGHPQAQPLLRPVAGEPGDEVAVGALVDQVHPVFHGAAGIVLGLVGGGHGGGGDVAVHLCPGGRRHRRQRLGGLVPGAGRKRQQRRQQQAAQRSPGCRSAGHRLSLRHGRCRRGKVAGALLHLIRSAAAGAGGRTHGRRQSKATAALGSTSRRGAKLLMRLNTSLWWAMICSARSTRLSRVLWASPASTTS